MPTQQSVSGTGGMGSPGVAALPAAQQSAEQITAAGIPSPAAIVPYAVMPLSPHLLPPPRDVQPSPVVPPEEGKTWQSILWMPELSLNKGTPTREVIPAQFPAPGEAGGQPPGGYGPVPPAPGWHQVGSDLRMIPYWDNGLWFETANRDWRIHIGGRLQYESVGWAQPQNMKGPFPGPGGIPASLPGAGVGALDDGMFFRRVRLRSDGVGYETVEYILEVDFEQLNYITYDHLWAGFRNVPILGTIRIGQQKVPQGMDNIGSDYHLPLLERAVLNEGIWASLFAPGILVANNFLNNNVSFQSMFHRVQPVQQFFTSDFGDGDYASTTRLTCTPLYKDDGANLIHLGASYQWRHADLGRTIQPGGTGNIFADTQHVVRFRARPELRDAIGVGTIGNGLLGGDPGRFVDTGYFLASNVHTISPEFLWIGGRFSVQAEGAWAFVENARSIYPDSAFGVARGTPMFWGGYIETTCFLTGEHRGYDRRFGIFDRPSVKENAFLVKGDDGRYHWGTGAWEVAYRYSFLDLNSNGIDGGQLSQHTFGINWYLNDNTKLQFQYSNIQRNVISPAVSGTVHGFGLLGQWYF